jgi:hypothetical protein
VGAGCFFAEEVVLAGEVAVRDALRLRELGSLALTLPPEEVFDMSLAVAVCRRLVVALLARSGIFCD